MVISGVPVIVHTDNTTVRGGEKNQISYTVDDLRVDSIVKLIGESGQAPDGTYFVGATALVIEPPDTDAPSTIDVAALTSSYASSSFLFLPIVGAFVGLLVGCVEGVICRTVRRAVRCGLFGLFAGAIGGGISLIGAEIVYGRHDGD